MCKHICLTIFLLVLLSSCIPSRQISIPTSPSTVPSSPNTLIPLEPSSIDIAQQGADYKNADIWRQNLASLSKDQQSKEALEVWKNSKLSELRDRAIYLVAASNLPESLAAQQALNRLYNSNESQKASMENFMQTEIQLMDNSSLSYVVRTIPSTQRTSFPWTIFLLEAAKRNLLENSPAVIAEITPFLNNSSILFNEQGSQSASLYSTNLALILPLSGPLTAIGQKVSNGANVAKQELADQGIQIGLTLINSEDPNWLNQVNALASNCVLIGGPIGTAKLNEAKNALLTNNKAFFSFSPQLDANDEGRIAWRFFTSEEDQINALLNFSMNELGINKFAIISPQDSYGQKMSDLFYNAAILRGASVQTSSYPVGSSVELTEITKSLVNSYKIGKSTFSRATFNAVFLPDYYGNMDLIVSNLNFNGEDRSVLLGTTLWEQSNIANFDSRNMELAVYPGTYNASFPNSAGTILNETLAMNGLGYADNWSVLGYDFIQFAAALQLDSSWTPQSLNNKLANLGNIHFSGAAITYNSMGKAKQDLLLLKPTKGGVMTIDTPSFIQERERINARYDRRINSARAQN